MLTKVKGNVFDSEDAVGVINVKDFGAVGDGVTDDTEAIQAALDTQEENILFPEGTYLVSNTLTITGNVTRIQNLGTIEFGGSFDEDFGIFADTGKSYVEIIGGIYLNSTTESGRTALHRCLRIVEADVFKVADVEVDGWYTCVHALTCGIFYADRVRMRNIYGKDPQYGYGINTSSNYATITDCHWDNALSSSDHGRHAIYINGTAEHVFVKGFFARGCARNPINIALDVGNSGIIKMDGIDLQDCNLDPSSPTAGCINASESSGTPPLTVAIMVDGLRVRNYAGCVFSVPEGGYESSTLSNVHAYGAVPGAVDDGVAGVYFRNCTAWNITNVYLQTTPTLPASGITIRDCNAMNVQNVRVTGSSDNAAVRLQDTTYTTILNVTKSSGVTETVQFVGTTTGSYYTDPLALTSVQVDIDSNNSVTVGERTSVKLQTSLTSQDLGSIVGSYDGQLVTIANTSGTSVNMLHNTSGTGVEELWLRTRDTTVLRDDDAVMFVKSGSRWIEIGTV
ncbi:pectin lyase fold/virulence factor [Vibrio phage 2.275.O._10N.286.54.E11]|nr:pectin lyase fold/virulence factor [Vibrio phage 2.275.O._10N.286.54.E11]